MNENSEFPAFKALKITIKYTVFYCRPRYLTFKVARGPKTDQVFRIC